MDARTPFIPNAGDDSGSNNDSTDWRSHRVEPGDATRMPFDARNQAQLGRPWVDSGAPPVPVFDCSLVPEKPTEINELDKPRGYHDVIFDTEGNLIGSDGSNLRASPDADTSDVWLPSVGDIQGMDWLPDGDIVAASGSAIVRINPDDGKSVITSGLYGYGITVGPDGMVYVGGAGSSVMKLDPETGDYDAFVGGFGGASPRVTNFSPDYSKMYVGTLGSGGKVFAVDLDKDLEPIGDPYELASGVGGGYHDGMGVDLCGNVYVNDYNTFSMYRVTPGGDVSLMHSWTWDDPGYGHGQDFGSGIGSWRSDAIYIAQPYDGNTVAEVVVAIPGRKYNNGLYKAINVDE